MKSNLKEKISDDFCLEEIFAEHFEKLSLNDESQKKSSKTSFFLKYTNFFVFFLICLQVLDGVFTYVGINNYGNEIEGNPLIQKLILSNGPSLGLFFAKLFTVLAILFLWKLRNKVTWIPLSIAMLTFYYMFFAILPWSIVLAGIF